MIQYEGRTLQEPLENMRASDLVILLHYQPTSSPISNLSLREIHRIPDGTIIHIFNVRCKLTRILKQHRELKHQIEYFYLQLLSVHRFRSSKRRALQQSVRQSDRSAQRAVFGNGQNPTLLPSADELQQTEHSVESFARHYFRSLPLT